MSLDRNINYHHHHLHEDHEVLSDFLRIPEAAEPEAFDGEVSHHGRRAGDAGYDLETAEMYSDGAWFDMRQYVQHIIERKSQELNK